jgi:hypothetical protein
MMRTSMHTIAAAVVFALAGGVYAQTAPQSSPPQRSAESADDSARKRIDAEHKAAVDRCKPMKGNAQDICKAEADGKKDIARAELKLAQKNTPENQRDVEQTKAKATYNVEKERCDELKGEAKDACQKQAKQARDSALASAKGARGAAPTMTREPGGTVSPGSTGGSPGSGTVTK